MFYLKNYIANNIIEKPNTKIKFFYPKKLPINYNLLNTYLKYLLIL